MASLNLNLHIHGWIIDPKLTIIYDPPPPADRTVLVALHDINGIQVSDTFSTVLESARKVKTWDLGDYISSQRQSKNLPVGLYLLRVEIPSDNLLFSMPIFLSTISTSTPVDQYLESIVIIDKITGMMLRFPASIPAIPLDTRYIVLLYYHKDRKGRIVKLNEYGQVEWDTGYHRYIELQVKYKFNTSYDLLIFMLNKTTSIPISLLREIINMINNQEIQEAITLLKPLYRSIVSPLGRVKIDVDTSSNEIRETIFTYIGWIDWIKVFNSAVIGCSKGVIATLLHDAIKQGFQITSLPASAGGCLAGAVQNMALAIINSADNKGQSPMRDRISQLITTAKAEILNEESALLVILNRLLSEGKITKAEYDQILQHITKMREIAFNTFDEILEDVETAHSEGYNKAVSDVFLGFENLGQLFTIIAPMMLITTLIQMIGSIKTATQKTMKSQT